MKKNETNIYKVVTNCFTHYFAYYFVFGYFNKQYLYIMQGYETKFYLKHTLLNFQDGDIKCSSTKIIYCNSNVIKKKLINSQFKCTAVAKSSSSFM